MLFIATMGAGGIFMLAAVALFITRSLDLGLGEGGVGLFYTTMGVGTLIGGVLAGAGTYTTSRALALAATGAISASIFMTLFGFANSLLLALPALILFGMVGDLQEIAGFTYFQHKLPDGVFGRFISLVMMAIGAGSLIGSLAGPLLAEVLDIGQVILLLALPTMVLGSILAVREGGLRFGMPAPASIHQPEVVGHAMFGLPSRRDMVADTTFGGVLLQPRARRFA